MVLAKGRYLTENIPFGYEHIHIHMYVGTYIYMYEVS
jgi:hypothetical protein